MSTNTGGKPGKRDKAQKVVHQNKANNKKTRKVPIVNEGGFSVRNTRRDRREAAIDEALEDFPLLGVEEPEVEIVVEEEAREINHPSALEEATRERVVEMTDVEQCVVNIWNQDEVDLRQLIILHFTCYKYDETGLERALGKIHLWASRTGFNKRSNWAVEAIQLVKEEYLRQQELLTFRDKLRLKWILWKRSIKPTWCWVWLFLALLLGASLLVIKWFPFFLTVGVLIVFWKLLWDAHGGPGFVVEKKEFLHDYCGQGRKLDVEDLNGSYEMPIAGRCEHGKVSVGFTLAPDVVWIPSSKCVFNDEIALVKRQIKPLLTPLAETEKPWKQALIGYKAFESPVDFGETKWSDEEAFELFVGKYPRARQMAIRKALYGLQKGNEPNRNIKGFCKREISLGKVDDKKDVRFISGFSDEQLVLTGPSYWAWFKLYLKHKYPDVFTALMGRFIDASALDALQRGEVIGFAEANGFNALPGDVSRMDGSTNIHALETVDAIEDYHFAPAEARAHIRATFNSKGVTLNGIKFKVNGTNKSGQINTKSRNVFVVFAATARFMHMNHRHEPHWFVMADGDDFILFYKDFALDVEAWINNWRELGYKIEGDVLYGPDDYDFLEFCSQRFWNIGDRRVPCPKVGRVLAKTFIALEKLSPKEMQAYVKGIAVGFKYYAWAPVLGIVCQCIINARSKVAATHIKTNPYKSLLKDYVGLVEQRSLAVQFERVYGLPLEMVEREVSQYPWGEVNWCATGGLMDRILEVDGVFGNSNDENLGEWDCV